MILDLQILPMRGLCCELGSFCAYAVSEPRVRYSYVRPFPFKHLLQTPDGFKGIMSTIHFGKGCSSKIPEKKLVFYFILIFYLLFIYCIKKKKKKTMKKKKTGIWGFQLFGLPPTLAFYSPLTG